MGENGNETKRPVVVFDVLGTLVDQEGGLAQQVSAATGTDEAAAREAVRLWLGHVAEQEREMTEGRRAFAPSHELDLEALHRLADEGRLPRGRVDELAAASQRLRPWPDTLAGLELLAADVTVIGLSNASRRVLTGLSGNSGMRWHQVLSAEDAHAYKPDPAVYELALSSAPAAAGPPFMAAAHAWDLRAAASVGMRTAYVPRPCGEPPAPEDSFDVHASDLRDLHAKLLASSG
jgi:2-haloacid dehalogenase